MNYERLVFWIFLLLFLARPAFGQAPTLPMGIPDFGASATVTVQAGASESWTLPQEIDGWLAVRGTLTLSSSLSVTGILVYPGGFLDVKSGASIVFRDGPINLTADPRQWGNGLIVLGRVRMLGVEKLPFFRTAAEPLAGHSTVTLETAPLTWAVGDEVFIPDTRQIDVNNWFNAAYALRHETRTITSITGVVISLNAPLSFDHRGARDANGTQNPKFLPHVANLTRSITVRSANPAGTRGHTVYTDRAQVDIRGVAFRDLGRTTTAAVSDADNAPNQIGRYPLHVHHLPGPVNPTNTGFQFTVAGNVIRDSRKWPIAVHASHYGLVEANVIVGGSDMTGAGIALEDGSETENLIRGNFVADIRGNINPRETGTGQPSSGLHPGSGGECIWAAGFNNRFTNNVVTGCRNTAQNIVAGVGFKFFVPPAPNVTWRRMPVVRGAAPTQYVDVISQYQPIPQFDGNEAYGLMADGLTIWHLGTDGYQWNPNQPETLIKDFRVWHTYESGIWNYPTNRVTIENFSYRYDPSSTPYRNPAITSGDYRTVNLTVRGGDLHVGTVLGQSTDFVGVTRLEQVRATSFYSALVFQTPTTPGTQAGRPVDGTTVVVTNPQITAWPGQPLRTIAMSHRTDLQPAWTTSPYTVTVTEGATTFRVCFPIQATEPLYGGTCTGTASRADIAGLIAGTGSEPPPPPPPPDVDATVTDFALQTFSSWSECVDGTQTREETWTRSVITPASGNGITPPLTETRTASQACEVPPPTVDPCVADPLKVTRIAWPTQNTGRRSITFDVGAKRWESFGFFWPSTLVVIDTRGCQATVTR